MYPHTIKHKHNHLIDLMSEKDDSERVLLEGANWKKLRFYQKSEALYQMTFVFCDRFLPSMATARWTRWCRRLARESRTS